MLSRENKIFKNLYNELGWDIDSAFKREDWKKTLKTLSLKDVNGSLMRLKLQN